MKILVLGLLFTLLLLIGCSQMIWKETNLQPEVIATNDPNTAVVVEVHYQEKDPWNPLNGTTDKKNYRTDVLLLKTETKETKVIKKWEIPSWVLANSVFYHSENKSLFLLQGRNDEYGTLDQKLTVYFENKPSFSYPVTPENLVIFQISPSPKGDKIALITALSDANWEFSEFELRILDPQSQKVTSHPLSFWTALPLYGMRWSNDSSALYIRTPDRILALRGETLSPTTNFPECFTPSTNYGKGAFLDSFVQSQNPWKLDLGKRQPEPKMITSMDKIKNCP
ncbi:MAG: hypothetical protein SH817_15610 [Leptospira sp.]|nr:hypothetical protein [Leptospira sp.]